MPKEFWVVLALATAVVVALHLEWRRHRRALRDIPIRIHVNGTRGKSSVTRLIAAALREQGVATVAKTTGTSARLVLPDGTERAVPRDGPPNLRELIGTIRRAARLGAEAVVFECMAVDPDLQRVAEYEIVRPTTTVITNARLDHTDAQGSTVDEVAGAFPVRGGGMLVTADPVVAAIKEPWLARSAGSVHLTSAGSVRPEELAAIGYLEHAENVAVALEVSVLCGVPRDVALRGMKRCSPDPGVASVVDVPHETGTWTLVNLFAANDPESTLRALEMAEATFDLPPRPLALFASRADRTARSAEFAAALAWEAAAGRFSKVVVWGEKTGATVRRLRRARLRPGSLVDAGSCSPAALADLLVREMDGSRAVVGVGNIIGPAHRLLEHVAERLDGRRPAGGPGAPSRHAEVPA